ncbi:hypothetical protein OG470_23970 [Micromonospora sp. NBC_00389]|uniref:hypothetical protein n=1 Tax=Micromonospora sp. NBC_00389 TaxID=2903586 RepID=UPI002E220156
MAAGQVTEHRYQARRLDVPVTYPFAYCRRRYGRDDIAQTGLDGAALLGVPAPAALAG